MPKVMALWEHFRYRECLNPTEPHEEQQLLESSEHPDTHQDCVGARDGGAALEGSHDQ